MTETEDQCDHLCHNDQFFNIRACLVRLGLSGEFPNFKVDDAVSWLLHELVELRKSRIQRPMTTLPNGLTDTPETIEKVVGKISQRII